MRAGAGDGRSGRFRRRRPGCRGRGGRRARRACRGLGPARAAARGGLGPPPSCSPGRGGGRRGRGRGRWRPRCETTVSLPAGLTALAALAVGGRRGRAGAGDGAAAGGPARSRRRADGRRPAPAAAAAVAPLVAAVAGAPRSSCRCRRRVWLARPGARLRGVHGRRRPRRCCRWPSRCVAAVRLRFGGAAGADRGRRSRLRRRRGVRARAQPGATTCASRPGPTSAPAPRSSRWRSLLRLGGARRGCPRGRTGSRLLAAALLVRRRRAAARASRLRARAQGRGRARRPCRPGAGVRPPAARLRPRRLRAGCSAAATATTAIPTSTRARSTCPATASTQTATARTRRDALPPPARDGRPCPRAVPPTSTSCSSPSTRCAPTTSAATATRARRRPTIDALAARRARCSRTAGRTRRRRATRCPRSPPGAGRRRSPGTSRSGGRGWPATCAPRPRRCTTRATSRAGMFSFNYFALADHRGFERGMDVLQRRARRAARRRQRPDGVARLVVARDDRRRDRVRRRAHATGSSSCGCTSTIRTSSYEPHPEVPSLRHDARRPLRRRDPLHRPARRPRCSRTCGRLGCGTGRPIVLTGDHGEGFGEHGVTEHGFDLYARADQGAVHRARARACRRAGARARRPRRHRADAAQPGARRAPSRRSSAARWSPTLAGPPAPDTDTRAVFQEVTSERGKKRALVTATRHLIWNAVPERHDRVLRPRARPGRGARHLGRARAATASACARSARALQAHWSPGWRCRAGAADKLARGVTPPGVARRRPRIRCDAALGDAIVGARLRSSAPTSARRGWRASR